MMPLPETVEIIDRLSGLESRVEVKFDVVTRQLAEMSDKLEILTAAYNQAQGARALGYAIAGFVGFVFANGKAIGLGLLGMLK